MGATKGFFSILQFCPDLDRGEIANVGVVLVVPALGFLGVRVSADNEGPKQLFGGDAFDDARLTLAKRALQNRIRDEGKEWKSPEDLAKFGRREGNNLLLGASRTILVEQPSLELDELFKRLVHVDAVRRRRQSPPHLEQWFDRPELIGVPIRRNVKVQLPKLGSLVVPYAYKNGRLNLIKPEGFPIDEKAATAKASELAVKAHVIYKHPDSDGEQRQLIVVGGFDHSATPELKERVEYVLNENYARLVTEEQMDALVEEVRREAH